MPLTLVAWILSPIFLLVAYAFLPSNTWAYLLKLESFCFTYANTCTATKKRLAALRKRQFARLVQSPDDAATDGKPMEGLQNTSCPK